MATAAELTHDARLAIQAVEAGKTMAQVGLSPERLRQMAQDEERLAEPPAIWPDMPYAEQRSRAQRLQEIEAFRLAKLWRVLAQDNDRVSQRVVIARGIEWKGELQGIRIFIHKATEPKINKRLPLALLLDADHDPPDRCGYSANEPAHRDQAQAQRRDGAGLRHSLQRDKLMGSATHDADIMALARRMRWRKDAAC